MEGREALDDAVDLVLWREEGRTEVPRPCVVVRSDEGESRE